MIFRIRRFINGARYLAVIASTALAAQTAQGDEAPNGRTSPGFVLAAIQAHADQLADSRVTYSLRFPPAQEWWQKEFCRSGGWFRVKDAVSEVGFDGTTYYSLDRTNTSAWLGTAPPESPIDSIHDPRYIGSIDPMLLKYLMDHLARVAMNVDQTGTKLVLSTQIPKEDTGSAFHGLAASCFGGVSLKLLISADENFAVQSEEERGLSPPTAGLLGNRRTWSGWAKNDKGLWFPSSHMIEVYGLPDQAGATEPLIFSEEYRYSRIEINCGLTRTDFLPPEIPAGYRVTDARAEPHRNIFLPKAVSNIETQSPAELVGLTANAYPDTHLTPEHQSTAVSPTMPLPVSQLYVYGMTVILATLTAFGVALVIKFRRIQ
jgi:hypothetical protein